MIFIIANLNNVCAQNIGKANIVQDRDTVKQQKASVQSYLKQRSDSSLVYRKLYDWLVVSKKPISKENPVIKAIRENNKKYEGYNIKQIEIKRISPFTENILDTLSVNLTKIQSLLTNLRFETKKGVIRNYLTFGYNEYLKNYELLDSERILRKLSFISEVIIIVQPISGKDVKIVVVTRDSYPYGVSLELGNMSASVDIYNENLFGYGIELEQVFDSRPTKHFDLGIIERLKWDNIYGSFVSFDMKYKDYYNTNYLYVKAIKDFFVPETKYAGGLKLTRNYKIDNEILDTIDIKSDNYDYTMHDYWFGRSFLIKSNNYYDRSNITFMGQCLFSNYYNKPSYLIESPYYNYTVSVFGSVAFSKHNYFRNNLIYNFGKTEDVPYGFLHSVSTGFLKTNKFTSFYLGLHSSFTHLLTPNKGYFYFSNDFQTFMKKGKLLNSVVNLKALYISPIFLLGKNMKTRSFLLLNYVGGFYQDHEQFIYLNERDRGLKALSVMSLRGNRKFVAKYENVLFTNVNFWGFKLAAFSFLDVAWINKNNFCFKSKPYYSIGFGFRVRNDFMVFKTFQVQLAYFPNLPPGADYFNPSISGEPDGDFFDFKPRKPYDNAFE